MAKRVLEPGLEPDFFSGAMLCTRHRSAGARDRRAWDMHLQEGRKGRGPELPLSPRAPGCPLRAGRGPCVQCPTQKRPWEVSQQIALPANHRQMSPARTPPPEKLAPSLKVTAQKPGPSSLSEHQVLYLSHPETGNPGLYSFLFLRNI